MRYFLFLLIFLAVPSGCEQTSSPRGEANTQVQVTSSSSMEMPDELARHSATESQFMPVNSDSGEVQFENYEESGQWKTWNDSRLAIRLPAEWAVSELTELDKEAGTWKYAVNDDLSNTVFEVRIVQGGPEWADKFCIPQEHYAQTIDSHFKFWAALIDFFPDREGGKAYGFRVSSRNLRLLIDAGLPDSPAPLLLYVIQSARPIESKATQ